MGKKITRADVAIKVLTQVHPEVIFKLLSGNKLSWDDKIRIEAALLPKPKHWKHIDIMLKENW